MNEYEKAINELLELIANKIPNKHKNFPVKAYIAGGVASYLHTKARVSEDIDMSLSHCINLPNDFFVVYDKNGRLEKLAFDRNYNDTLGLMHEDYPDRAIQYKIYDKKFEVFILSPVDIVISKVLRLSDNDEQDIKALINRGLIDKNEFIELVDDAINVGVGFQRSHAITNKELVLEYFDELPKLKNEWLDSNKEATAFELLKKRRVDIGLFENMDFVISNNYIVINEEVERSTYLSFAKLCECFGGEWNTKTQALHFSDDGIKRMIELFPSKKVELDSLVEEEKSVAFRC